MCARGKKKRLYESAIVRAHARKERERNAFLLLARERKRPLHLTSRARCVSFFSFFKSRLGKNHKKRERERSREKHFAGSRATTTIARFAEKKENER